MTAGKVCTSCGETKALDEFYPSKDGRLGLEARCKVCRRTTSAARMTRLRQDEPDQVRAVKAASYRRHADEVRAKTAAYYAQNIDKARADARRYHAEHKVEANAARQERYRERGEAAIVREARALRPELRESAKAWRARNPDRVAMHDRNKRAKRRGAPGAGFTPDEFAAQIAAQDGRCFWCDVDLAVVDIHADHFWPLARGGSHDADNVVAACAACNCRKKALLPDEWARRLAAEWHLHPHSALSAGPSAHTLILAAWRPRAAA